MGFCCFFYRGYRQEHSRRIASTQEDAFGFLKKEDDMLASRVELVD